MLSQGILNKSGKIVSVGRGNVIGRNFVNLAKG